ncbi:MAG: Rne/Rng family ribonuclease [Candidatus Sumerlaeaceae bacterium]|nr:Rne/Rng family ribonuclease [Candidatus Sumerlaeaceae bacterium]
MKKVLINVEEREVRVAILEDDQLTELYIESLDDKTILNNIYKGRIEGIIPGLKAAFVNVGFERNAFLHFDDIRPDLLFAPDSQPSQPVQPDVDQHSDVGDETDANFEEYQPSEQELEAAKQFGEAAPEVSAGAAPQTQFERKPFDQDRGFGGRKRRRRRGRKGRGFRDGFEGQGGGQAPQEPESAEEQPRSSEGPSPAQPTYQGGGGQGQNQRFGDRREFGGKRRRRNRGRDRDRGDRQPFGSGGNRPQQAGGPPPQRPVEDNDDTQPAWLANTPPERPAYGTRAATDPFDVYTPYSQNQKGRAKKGGRRNFGSGQIRGESQTDFFPMSGGRQMTRGEIPQSGGGHDHFEDDYDGPAPGNEKFPDQAKRPQGGGKKGRNPRGMRRRGPSYYAVRNTKSKTAKDESEKPVKAKKVTKVAAEKAGKPKAAKKAKAAEKPLVKKAEKAPAKTAAKKETAKTAKTKNAAPAKPKSEKAAKPRKSTDKTAASVAEAKPRKGRKKAEIVEASQEVRGITAHDVLAPPPAKVEAPVAPAAALEQETAKQEPAQPARSITPDDVPHQQRRFDRHRDFRQRQPQHQHQQPKPFTPPAPRRKVLPVTQALKKGDEIVVQIIKEEIGLKGARISTYLSMPGRYLVLLPYPEEEGGISRKVENFNERKRLKRILKDIRKEIADDQVGFIVRTAGIDRDENEIRNDVEFLMSEWTRVQEKSTTAKAPELIYDDSDILYRLARDVFDESISEILIDSEEQAEILKKTLGSLIPGLVDKVHLYNEPENLFHKYQVEKQIQKAGRRKVWLKSGGYLIIDEAEALTAIDVNTGKFIGKDDQEKMILKNNLEAARAIARELKLRDIGGLIVIDFIDMRDSRNREQLLNEFRACLRKDRSKTSVSAISEFGLVEMTRKRVRQSLRKTLFMDCPYCQGAGVVLNEQQIWMHIKHEIIGLLEGTKTPPSLTIVTNPKIKAYIDQNYRDTLDKWCQKYDVKIDLVLSDAFHIENYALEKQPRRGQALDEESTAEPVGA